MGIAKDLVNRQHDMLRQRDVSQVADLYTADGHFSMAGVQVSPTQLPTLMNAYLSAFPDASNEVTSWIETEDGVAFEQIVLGTHTGPWMTPLGEIAPTGKQLRWQAVEFVRVRDGKIASWHSYFDQLQPLMALGALPQPAES